MSGATPVLTFVGGKRIIAAIIASLAKNGGDYGQTASELRLLRSFVADIGRRYQSLWMGP